MIGTLIIAGDIDSVKTIAPKDVVGGRAGDGIRAGAACGDKRDIACADGVIACAASEASGGPISNLLVGDPVVTAVAKVIVSVDNISNACGEGDEGVITAAAVGDGGARDGVVTGVAAEPGGFERALIGASDVEFVVASGEVVAGAVVGEGVIG